jgi:hypothetical protein
MRNRFVVFCPEEPVYGFFLFEAKRPFVVSFPSTSATPSPRRDCSDLPLWIALNRSEKPSVVTAATIAIKHTTLPESCCIVLADRKHLCRSLLSIQLD